MQSIKHSDSGLGRAIFAAGHWAWRHHLWVLAGALVLAVLSWGGVRQIRISTDLRALLPESRETVLRLDRARERIGAQSDFIVAIRSPDRAANLRFGEALAAALRKMPEFRYAIFRRDVELIKKHALLYLPLPDLLDLRQDVIDRIRREIAKRTVVQLDDDPEDGEDAESKWRSDPDKLLNDSFGGAVMPGTYLEADKGRLVVVKAKPIRETTDVQFCIALVGKVEKAIATLQPARYHADLQASVQGDYVSRAGEVSKVHRAVTATIGFAATLLLLVILAYFRRLSAVPIVLLPVIVSSVMTVGIAGVVWGTFNLVTTFIFAVLLGLGIDFAIHCLARYAFERRRGADPEEALRHALCSTGRALLAGALTTAIAFFALQLGEFKGFSQFGAVAGMGVLLALTATYLLVPASLALVERFWPRQFAPRGAVAQPTPKSSEPSRSTRLAWPRIAAASIFVVGASVAALALGYYRSIPFEYDFNKLGPEKPKAADTPTAKVGYRDAIGRRTAYGPAVALCASPAQCRHVLRLLRLLKQANDRDIQQLFDQQTSGSATSELSSAALSEIADDDDLFDRLEAELDGGRLLPTERSLLRELGKPRLSEMRFFLQAYLGLDSLVPEHQPLKLRIIADIKRRIDRKRGSLSAKTKEQLVKWDPYLSVAAPVSVDDLPDWFVNQLTETDGAVGRFAVLWNRGFKADYRYAKRLHSAFFELPDGPKTVPVAANYFVLVDVIDTLRAEGPTVIGTVGGAIFMCLIVAFRSARAALLVLVPLVVSIGWLAAAFLLLGWKVNLFSIVAFPLLMGMGIDNGIHIYHRWRETRRVGLVLREVGGPITLTTLTTFIGFAGLIYADHVGVKTLGLTAAFGMWLTHLGAVVVLPALLYLVDRPTPTPRRGT